MTPDPSWKAFERRIAASLGVNRTPLSGGASRLTRSDTLHPTLYVECKQRARIATYWWWMNARHKARDEHKVPVLVLHQKKQPHTLAVISWDYFVGLYLASQSLAEIRRTGKYPP